jgi:hypothetical protein
MLRSSGSGIDHGDQTAGVSDWTEAFDAAVDRTVASEDSPYTIADARARSSLDLEAMERLVRAVGWRWPEPGEAAFGESDLALFGSYALARAAFGEEFTLHVARNMSMAMARIGQAAIALFLVTQGESLRGQPEAARLAGNELSSGAFNTLPQVLERLVRLHALRAVHRWRQYRDGPQRYDVRRSQWASWTWSGSPNRPETWMHLTLQRSSCGSRRSPTTLSRAPGARW